MAGPLAAVERFFERLFERPAARLFQARVEPVQIQRSLERAMESERVVQSRRAYAPTVYRVLLSASDIATLDGDRTALRNELGESLRVYARSHGYTMLARPQVEIEGSSVVSQGDIRVFAEPPAVPAPAVVANDGPRSPFQQPIVDDIPIVSQQTAVYAAPQPTVPRAVLAIRTPGLAITRLPIRAGTLRMGRSHDNEIILDDDRVSRRHGQLALRQGMIVYTDLGSTNGSFMNGAQVTEIALGPGDVLQIGSSTITIEPAN